jgi:hypothetical protein
LMRLMRGGRFRRVRVLEDARQVCNPAIRPGSRPP